MDIIIIGAGPSGLMCAINAKNKNNNVTILERNDKIGKKLLLTGSGRCNFANEKYSDKDYFSSSKDLIKNVINDKNVTLMHDTLEDLCIYKDVINGHCYPYSHNSASICNILLKKCESLGIKIMLSYFASDIKKVNNKFIINNDLSCDKLVLASGAKSYPKTGSDGNMYDLIKKLGLNVTPLYPGLTQIKTMPINDLNGIRANAKVSLYDGDNLIAFENGEILFTSFGLSGICIFNLSMYVKNKDNLTIKINFLPFAPDFYETWLNKFNDVSLINAFETVINYKILKYIFKKTKINENAKYKSLTEKEKNLLKEYLVNFSFKVEGVNDFDKAQVTIGGVNLNEIDTFNFSSLKDSNLYIIGELIDLTGKCGGYNLMECFISGILSGKDIYDKS